MSLSAADVAPAAFSHTQTDNLNEKLRFDLQNLTAFNEFEQLKPSTSEELEQFMLDKASEGTQQLLANLFSLPSKKSDVGPLALLPGYSKTDLGIDNSLTALPRSKPPPAPKEETRWSQFAKEKGLEDKKRGRKEWDEATGEWKVRYGMGSANKAKEEYPIMPAVAGDPNADPWEHQKSQKRAKVEKNNLNRLKNQERTGAVPKGTASKYEKKITEDAHSRSVQKTREAPGIPLDLSSGSASKAPGSRGLANTKRALEMTRLSTASMGKFDAVRSGEGKQRRSGEELKIKRKGMTSIVSQTRSQESANSLKVLDSVLKGSAKKQKMIKTGQMSSGETGHDYDYDDNLGGGKYRKKKGRAGAGKLKSASKKMIK